MDDCEIVEAKTKSKMIFITLMTLLYFFLLVVIIGVLLTKACVDDLLTHVYYVLEVDETNRENILLLLKNEGYEYCESIRKIEYTQTFMDGLEGKIFCGDNDDAMRFKYDDKSSKLFSYVLENGNVEKRHIK